MEITSLPKRIEANKIVTISALKTISGNIFFFFNKKIIIIAY